MILLDCFQNPIGLQKSAFKVDDAERKLIDVLFARALSLLLPADKV